MSISQNFPAISPTLNLNFARSKKLDPRITFTRTSSATRTNAQGLIEVVSANTPRFDHSYNSSTGSVNSLGLLIEESRTNLVTDSATNFNYSFNNQVISTANDVAPDGTTVLCKHDLTGATLPFLNCRANTTLNAGTYTMSMYLKGTTSFSGSFAFVGETNNEIYSNTANITTTWQRFTLTFTLLATSTLSRLQLFFSTQGEGKIVSVWGAQLEAGSFATTYIARSSGAQATRSADNASMTGTNFSSWYNSTEGTLGFIGDTVSPSSYSAVYQIDNGDANNRLYLDKNSSTGRVVSTVSGSNQCLITLSTISSNTLFKLYGAYKLNDCAGSFNGGTVGIDTSATMPTCNMARIGTDGTNYINGRVAQLTYYPKRLSNSQLQNLTK